MRIVVHGQQAFGKAVLEALIKRGENVIAVYVAPEKEGAKADPLKEAAIAAKLPVYQPASYKDPKVWEEFKALKPDLQDARTGPGAGRRRRGRPPYDARRTVARAASRGTVPDSGY